MITTGQLSICGESHENDAHIFTRSKSVVSRVVAGETLIVPVRGKVGDLASIYSFNGTGSLIWKLLETPRSMNELIGAVAQEFDVDRERAALDVKNFVDEMIAVSLVEVPMGTEGPVGREGLAAADAGYDAKSRPLRPGHF